MLSEQGPTPILRVKRKRTTPVAPELVVEGLLSPANKRRAILDYFSNLGVAETSESSSIPKRCFQYVASSDAADQPEVDQLLQCAGPCRQAKLTDLGSNYQALSSVTYCQVRLPPEGDSLSQLFHLYHIAAEEVAQAAEARVPTPTAAVSAPDMSHSKPQSSLTEPASDLDKGGDDDMYDFYTLCPDDQLPAGWTLQASMLPSVKIHDDLWLVDEAAHPDSNHDSEDSNAESYYANSYPEDEDASADDKSDRRFGSDEDESGSGSSKRGHGLHEPESGSEGSKEDGDSEEHAGKISEDDDDANFSD